MWQRDINNVSTIYLRKTSRKTSILIADVVHFSPIWDQISARTCAVVTFLLRSGYCCDIHGKSAAKLGYSDSLAAGRFDPERQWAVTWPHLSDLWPVCSDQSEQTGLFGRGALKRQALKRSISDRGWNRCCSNTQYEKNNVFFEQYTI